MKNSPHFLDDRSAATAAFPLAGQGRSRRHRAPKKSEIRFFVCFDWLIVPSSWGRLPTNSPLKDTISANSSRGFCGKHTRPRIQERLFPQAAKCDPAGSPNGSHVRPNVAVESRVAICVPFDRKEKAARPPDAPWSTAFGPHKNRGAAQSLEPLVGPSLSAIAGGAMLGLGIECFSVRGE